MYCLSHRISFALQLLYMAPVQLLTDPIPLHVNNPTFHQKVLYCVNTELQVFFQFCSTILYKELAWIKVQNTLLLNLKQVGVFNNNSNPQNNEYAFSEISGATPADISLVSVTTDPVISTESPLNLVEKSTQNRYMYRKIRQLHQIIIKLVEVSRLCS